MERSLKFTSRRPVFFSLIGILVVLIALPILFFASAAPIASATMMQNPVCSALPVPSVQRGTDITSSAGLLNDFVVGDFNNDGKKDVVVEAWLPPGGGFPASHSELRTFLGNGSGGFTLAGTYSTDYNRLVPGSAADFNGDGRQDVLMYGNNATGTGQQTINVITANANGVLGTTAQIFNYVNSDQYGRATLKTGDFNNDGRADFALSITCCPDANYVYLSNSNGTHTRTTFNWGGSRVAIVGDINGDGNQDVVTSDNYYHAYTIRLGNGRGQFTTGQLLDYGVYLYFIGATDYNKDGRVDFVTYTGGNRAGLPDVNSNRIIVLTANSAGQITRFLTSIVPELNPPALTTPVATGDFTGDGNMDFVDGNTKAFLSNGGNGIYCASAQLVSGVTNSEVLEAADFNGDGKADLLRLGQRFDTKIEVWLSGTSGPTNTPPTITAAAASSLLQGTSTLFLPLATVNDAQTPAGSLTVTATNVPAGITINNIVNNLGQVSATVAASCSTVIGQNLIELTVTDANGASAKANYTLNVQERTGAGIFSLVPDTITLPIGLGAQYPINVDQFVYPTITPPAGFSGTIGFHGNFTFSMLPIAGSGPLLRLSNVGPVGTHTFTLTTTTRCGKTVTKTVTLIVTGETAACPFPKYGRSNIAPFSGINNAEVADFNKDGKLDIAFVHAQPANTLGVVLGDGAGNFGTARSYEAGKVNGTLRVGDFNGDTFPDLISATTGTNWVILLNDRSGGFTALTKPASAQNISFSGFELYGDVNKDGRTDIVRGGNPFTVYLSNGDSSFNAVVSTPTGADLNQISTPSQIGDFNGDGNLDLAAKATLNGSFSYHILSGVGTGSFPTATRGNSPFWYGAFSWVLRDGIGRDFNKDGRAETPFIGGSDPEAGASVAYTGTFAEIPTFSGLGVAGDYNGDGNLDILFNQDGRIILNRGSDPNRWCAAPGGYDGLAFDVGDLDSDGKTDLVAVSGGVLVLSLSTRSGPTNTPPTITLRPFTINQGSFSAPILGTVSDAETPSASLQLSATNLPTGVTITNLRSDPVGGILAVLTVSCTTPVGTYQIPIKVTDGGGLSATANWPLTISANQAPLLGTYINPTITGSSFVSTPTRPPSDDGSIASLTVIAPSYTGTLSINPVGVVTITNNNLPGTYQATVTATDNCGAQASTTFTFTIAPTTTGCAVPTFNTPQSYSANNRPYGLASGDFNGDGRIDLVTTNLWDHTITVLTNNGNGFTKAAPIAVGVLPNYVAARDLNGDNRLDLVVVNRGSDTVTILLGNGNGTFTKKGDYGVGNKSTGVAIGDFNGDGKLDLLLPNDGLGNVAVLNGNGDGSFQPLRFLFAGSSPQPGVVADFNRDGRADVALPNYFSGEVAILLGNAAGTFASPIYINNLGGPGVEAIALGDVNGDGNVDLAVTNTTTNQVFTILSDGRGGFTRGGGFATFSNYPASIVIADFNSDGRADIAVGGYSDNQVRVFKGLTNGFDNNAPLVLPVGNDPLSLLTNDFNGDGKPDLAIANQGAGTVSVLLNRCGN